MRYRAWAAFKKGGSPLFIDFDKDTIEEAWEFAHNMFNKAERVLLESLDTNK